MNIALKLPALKIRGGDMTIEYTNIVRMVAPEAQWNKHLEVQTSELRTSEVSFASNSTYLSSQNASSIGESICYQQDNFPGHYYMSGKEEKELEERGLCRPGAMGQLLGSFIFLVPESSANTMDDIQSYIKGLNDSARKASLQSVDSDNHSEQTSAYFSVSMTTGVDVEAIENMLMPHDTTEGKYAIVVLPAFSMFFDEEFEQGVYSNQEHYLLQCLGAIGQYTRNFELEVNDIPEADLSQNTSAASDCSALYGLGGLSGLNASPARKGMNNPSSALLWQANVKHVDEVIYEGPKAADAKGAVASAEEESVTNPGEEPEASTSRWCCLS